MEEGSTRRRLPVGAEVVSHGVVEFRVWAPRRRRVEVFLEGGPGAPGGAPLDPEGNGYFSGRLRGTGPGTLYRYALDGEGPFPDPASRFQPEGPHGPSRVVDPGEFPWTDGGWRGVALRDAVVYELHVGTFTPEGTWAAAAGRLADLAELGVTVIEVMPSAEFPGAFGWGYDGVDLFAPTRLYGEPDDFRRLVDRAHALGLAVTLDVVYNHFGPDGCYLSHFSPAYFSDRYRGEWGDPLNFDGEDSAPVREFVTANAGYWIDEYHLDGLRLDATQGIHDASLVHIIREITARVRAAAPGRATLVMAENEPQETRLAAPAAAGGLGVDALWNDDFHHSVYVALTGRAEAYYTDFRGAPQELISAAKYGYLFQGQRHSWQSKRRGTPARGLPAAAFVVYLENHDQVANSATGERLHRLGQPGQVRALTAVLLLLPATPLLFQGQEFGASSPFRFFADHRPELAAAVREGRHALMRQFASLASPEADGLLPDPSDPATFLACKLDPAERERNAATLALHRDLLRLRREDAVLRERPSLRLDGAVLGPEAFLLRYFAEGDPSTEFNPSPSTPLRAGSAEGLRAGSATRLLVVNLGSRLRLDAVPEPLLAPPAGWHWETLWSSEDPRYGGQGTPPLETDRGWRLPGRSAVLLAPVAGADLAPARLEFDHDR